MSPFETYSSDVRFSEMVKGLVHLKHIIQLSDFQVMSNGERTLKKKQKKKKTPYSSGLKISEMEYFKAILLQLTEFYHTNHYEKVLLIHKVIYI